VDEPVPPVSLSVQPAFLNLTFSRPVAMLQAPNDSSRWFVVEQAGRVRVFSNDSGANTSNIFIDISGRVASGGEMGLLGMAFHPAFATNRRVYLSYTNTTAGRVSRISEFKSNDNGDTLDPNSERILLVIDQPEENHKGGQIAFGADGYLYIGMGDGGGRDDQHGGIGNGQLMKTLLGKMLRIGVDNVPANQLYAIPLDNPFVGNALCGTVAAGGTGSDPCPEIYASGFRNPWRWSFDRQTGQLWVGDVGQDRLEEIDRVTLGGNYGWRCFEGTLPTNFDCGSEPNLLPPVAEYGRTIGQSVTGGYVYRGTAIAGLNGRYVFGDFISKRIWNTAATTTGPTREITGGFASGLSISSFGEGVDGELYVVHYDATNGALYRLTSP
jgi:glucose/arabinose dehydrogenase